MMAADTRREPGGLTELIHLWGFGGDGGHSGEDSAARGSGGARRHRDGRRRKVGVSAGKARQAAADAAFPMTAAPVHCRNIDEGKLRVELYLGSDAERVEGGVIEQLQPKADQLTRIGALRKATELADLQLGADGESDDERREGGRRVEGRKSKGAPG